jgi:hypothetical protein
MKSAALLGLIVFAVTSIQADDLVSEAPLFQRAIVAPADVAKAAEFEAKLKEHSEMLAPAGVSWIEVLDGKSKVLVLAPHATSQIREGKVKPADGGTGSLAVALNRLAGTPVLYTTYRSPKDPNYYDDNEFKAKVKELVSNLKPTLVLDLHGSDYGHPYDVDFGTRFGKSLLGKGQYLKDLASQLRSEGIFNFSQDYFPAEKQQSDTQWVSLMGTPCIQLEINANWISAGEDGEHDQKFAKLLEGLVRFVQAIDAK